MAEGATIKAKLEKAKADLVQEEQAWRDANLPYAGDIWEMGRTQFMTRCHIFALDKVLRELVGDDKFELIMTETITAELKKLRPHAVEVRRLAIREQIVDGKTLQYRKLDQ